MKPELKQLLENSLNSSYTTVTFTKADGTERVMECTRDSGLIPDLIKASTGTGGVANDEVARVYEKNVGWRSFRYDSVKSFIAKVTV